MCTCVMLWSHKYNPLSDSENRIHDDHVNQLKKLFGSHVIVYGAQGTGKKTIVQLILRSFGIESNLKRETITIHNEKKEIDVIYHTSRRHVEILLTPYGNNEKYIVKHFINELAKHMTFNESGELTFKYVIVYHLEHISQACQHLFSVFMDKYTDCSRFIFVTNSLNRITGVIQSRCMTYRVQPPSNEVLLALCKRILSNEKLNIVKNVSVVQMKKWIANDFSIDDLLYKVQSKSMDMKHIFEDIISEIAKCIVKKNVKLVREHTYILIVNNIEANVIIKELLKELVLHDKVGIRVHELVRIASIYEHRLLNCERVIYHLEAFTQTASALF